MPTFAKYPKLESLSQPKTLPANFRENRRSVYFPDKMPPEANGNSTEFSGSDRLKELSSSKELHSGYLQPRESPIWEVSPSAQNAVASDHVENLASPKQPHPNWQEERNPYTKVSTSAKSYNATQRIEQLSTPIARKLYEGNTEEEMTSSITKVSETAKKGRCSSRVETLSEPKKVANGYLASCPPSWPVSESAKKASASNRLQILAMPESRKLVKEERKKYFNITSAAKSAKASQHVVQLACPLQRKLADRAM